jgi:branched-subunit amino acid aminotransferase/4-amino-4-deoxychorismate lyase
MRSLPPSRAAAPAARGSASELRRRLEGVTRSVLLEIAARAGVSMSEKTLKLEDLYAADEVFITSTNRTLLGVSEISGHRYPVVMGPLVQKLERAFDANMREYVAARSSAVRA